jgi:hypothetical protein
MSQLMRSYSYSLTTFWNVPDSSFNNWHVCRCAVCYRNEKFITIFIRVCYLSLFWATCIESMPFYLFYLRSTIMFSTQPFEFQISAAAGALFNLSAHCGAVFPLSFKKDVHLMAQYCPICQHQCLPRSSKGILPSYFPSKTLYAFPPLCLHVIPVWVK